MQLKQLSGKEYFKLDNNSYGDADLARMSADELKSLKARVDAKIHFLASAIKQKRIDFSSGGKGASKEWYANKKYALMIYQRILPYLNDLIKQRNRDERSLSDYFVDEARIYLPGKDFDAIMQNAEREKRLMTNSLDSKKRYS
jgi:hypothetical protein